MSFYFNNRSNIKHINNCKSYLFIILPFLFSIIPLLLILEYVHIIIILFIFCYYFSRTSKPAGVSAV